MTTLRMAVIGTGLAWERLHYPAIRELGDKYKVVAVCDTERSKAEAEAGRLGLRPSDAYADFRQMLKRDDIDLVDILVPISQNYEVSRDVAKAGKDFICEKPLAPDLEQALESRELPVKYGVRAMIAENYKYEEENNKIRDLVNSGKIGDPVYFMMNNASCFPCQMTGDTWAATEWRQHPDFPGGAILDAALHDLARVRHIFGAVEKVHAFGKPQKADFSPYVSAHVNMLFKSGVIGQFAYWPSGNEAQRPLVGFRIFGTNGEIYLEDKTCGVINVAYNDGNSERVPYTPGRGYYNELLNFYNAKTGKEQVSVTPEAEFGDAKMVFDILASLKDGAVRSVDADPSAFPQPEAYAGHGMHKDLH